jgi:hypothetical protein
VSRYFFPIFETVLGCGLLLHSLIDVSNNELASAGLAWFIACGLFLDMLRRVEKLVAEKSVYSLRQRSVRIISINHGVHYDTAK